VTETLLMLLKVAVGASIFAIGMGSTLDWPACRTFRRVHGGSALGSGGGNCESISHPVGGRDGRKGAPPEGQRAGSRSPAFGSWLPSDVDGPCASRHALGLGFRGRMVGDDYARGPDAALDCPWTHARRAEPRRSDGARDRVRHAAHRDCRTSGDVVPGTENRRVDRRLYRSVGSGLNSIPPVASQAAVRPREF
jgi:hypothetical protein